MTADAFPVSLAAERPVRKRWRRKVPYLLADAAGVAKALNLGLRTVRALDAGGKLPAPRRLGGRVLWSLRELRDWISAGCPDRETWAGMRAR